MRMFRERDVDGLCRRGLPLAFAAVLLVAGGCGGETADRDTSGPSVAFPNAGSQRALHCYTVLYLRAQQIEDVAGEGRLGDWVASDYAEAQTNASLEAGPSVQGDSEAIATRIREVMNAFDANSDETIDGREEQDEFARHVRLCMEEYSPAD